MPMQLVSWPPAPRADTHVFADPTSLALLSHLEKVAPSEASILIIGETGTGKELVARQVHALSHRRTRPFVAVNCGAFSEALVDAELFGHEKGAFTGALGAKAGWFEEADGGTLFLDEIGDLPMSLQVKLLRVLQEREVVRLGSRKPIPIDVRVLAATNKRLDEAIAAGQFRKDLYYRLNVVTLQLQPLHQRPGDILPLAAHFIRRYGERMGYGDVALEPAAAARLAAYGWPGNIRELENVVHHALLVSQDGSIRAADLHLPGDDAAAPLAAAAASASVAPVDESADAQLQRALQRLIDEQGQGVHETVEDALLRAAYRHCRYNQVHTAQLLGLSRNITRARLIRLGELVVNRRGAGGEDDDDGAGDPRTIAVAI